MMNEQITSDEMAPALTASEAEHMIVKNLPPVDHHGEKVEHVDGNSIRVRLPYNSAFMGAESWQDGSGQVFSGPMVMGFADTAMYYCVMAVSCALSIANLYYIQPLLVEIGGSFHLRGMRFALLCENVAR